MPTSVTRAFQGQLWAFVPGFCNLSAVTVNGSAVTYTNTAGIIRLDAPLNQGDALALTYESFRPADTGKNIGFGDGGGTVSGGASGSATPPASSSLKPIFDSAAAASVGFTINSDGSASRNGEPGWKSLKSNPPKSAGKWYFEVLVSKLGTGGEINGWAIGISPASFDATNRGGGPPGRVNDGGVIYSGNRFEALGNRVENLPVMVIGDTIGVAVEFGKTITFYKNNNFVGSVDITSIAGVAAYPTFAAYYSDEMCIFTAKYTPPSGFTAWG